MLHRLKGFARLQAPQRKQAYDRVKRPAREFLSDISGEFAISSPFFVPPERVKNPIGPRGMKILRRIARDCSDHSYCVLSIKTLSQRTGCNHSRGRAAMKLLAEHDLIDGHWSLGWRLTAFGWAVIAGEVTP